MITGWTGSLGWRESRKEAGSWKLEAGKLEAGSWKLEAGSWKLEAGSWKLESVGVGQIFVKPFLLA
jgi:hypothetical protein